MINKHPCVIWIFMIISIITLIFLIGFTIYIQQPESIEVHQIAFAGKETININNKYIFDLFTWAPGYTDQALIQINNNTNTAIRWTIYFENLENIDEHLKKAIGVYIKENATNRDVLPMYNSVITEGYKYYGTLSELQDSKVVENIIKKNESPELLSILLHVTEDSQIQETHFEFRNILRINVVSDTINISKIFE